MHYQEFQQRWRRPREIRETPDILRSFDTLLSAGDHYPAKRGGRGTRHAVHSLVERQQIKTLRGGT
jgi:hypothetical protein